MENNKINVGPVRLSYPNLFTPQALEGSDKKKFNVCLLIPKDDTALRDKITKAIAAAIPEGTKVNGKLPKNYRIPLRDGDTEKEDRKEYQGMYFLNCSSTIKPQVVKKVNGVFTDAKEEEVYPGCWAYVNINFYPYDRNGNRGISVSLNAVCKFKDDDSFSGSSVGADKLFATDIPDTVQAAMNAVQEVADDDLLW